MSEDKDNRDREETPDKPRRGLIDRFLFVDSPGKKDLAYWRERILTVLLGSGLLIGIFVLVPSVMLAVKVHLWGLAVVDTLVYGGVLILFLGRRLPFIIRSLCLLTLVYVIGVGICLSLGLISGGPAWLFSFVILSGILLGLKGALSALLINMITMGALGWIVGSDALGLGFPFFRDYRHAVVAGVNYILLDAAIAVSVAVLLEGLQETAEKEEAMARFLEVERTELIVAKEILQGEVEGRRKAMDALVESEARFREMAELLPETIYEMDLSGKVTFANHAAFERFGYDPEDLEAGLKGLDLLVTEDRERATKNIAKILSGEEIGITEYTGLGKDGRTFPVIFHSAPIIRGGKPVGLRGFVIDVSERKQLEKQFYQAQRLESIGTLAGGIAHDFNNLLMGIQGRTSMVLAEADPSQPHYRHLKAIEEHVVSAAHLTQQLLGFARSGKYEIRATDLNRLMEKTLDMFGRTRKEVRIFKNFQPDLDTVEVDQGQIQQVLLNLFVNAWQAMPGGGQLFLETSNAVLEERDTAPYSVPSGSYVRISVTDTGTGMEPEVRERIFEPFFTTKPRGRGTGLGLATAYGIIRNHGGFIQVASEKGKGSTFEVYLPGSKRPAEEEGRSQNLRFPSGSGKVLLVDDEQMIREIGQLLLERMGYTVRTAADGHEALKILEEGKNDIDLVILDIIMPGLGGGETFDRIREISPGMRVLLSSGYSLDGEAAEILKRGCKGFIQKPFTLENLSDKLREILAGKPG